MKNIPKINKQILKIFLMKKINYFPAESIRHFEFLYRLVPAILFFSTFKSNLQHWPILLKLKCIINLNIMYKCYYAL